MDKISNINAISRNTSIEVWDGTDDFDINKFLKQYSRDYKYFSDRNKELGGNFHVQYGIPVFMLPIVYYDINWQKHTTMAVLETWIDGKFLDKDILYNIKEAQNIDLLDLKYSETGLQVQDIEQSIFEKYIKKYIKEHPQCIDVIIENYCYTQQQKLDFYTSQKTELTKLKSLWKNILTDLQCPLTTNRDLISPKYLEDMIWSTKLMTWKTYFQINEYKNTIFDLLRIEKDREYIINMPLMNQLLQNLCDVDTMIENIWKQKSEFKREIIDKINLFNENPTHVLEIDSKYLFFENGNDLYNNILLESSYKDYYLWECDNLEHNFEKIKQYCHPFFIDLWCGAGTKDEIIMRQYDKHKLPLTKAIFIDSSITSLKNCNYKLSKNTKQKDLYNFSTDRINNMNPDSNSWDWKWFHVFKNPNIPSDNQTVIWYNTLSEWPCTFSMRWWTLWCFWSYKNEFLKTIWNAMKKWDTFLVSIFEKPTSTNGIPEIISKYNNTESERFVMNFLQKIWIPKNAMKFSVEYNHDAIEIFIDISNPRWDMVKINAFWETTNLKNGTRLRIHESERFNKASFVSLLRDSSSGLDIVDIIPNHYWGPVLYVLKKQ